MGDQGPGRLAATLDHVAVAVHDPDLAARRWHDRLGGRWVARSEFRDVRAAQLRFAGGAKLELVSARPGADGSPVRAFLARHGPGLHHVTLKVADLGEALDVLERQGWDAVGVDRSRKHWQEAFLRPSQVGGFLVQVAASACTDESWAASLGHAVEVPPPTGANLLGMVLQVLDLDEAEERWQGLGARTRPWGDGLVCEWSDSPLRIALVPGELGGPRALLFAGTQPLPADEWGPRIDIVDPSFI